jgi:hypothetical protein
MRFGAAPAITLSTENHQGMEVAFAQIGRSKPGRSKQFTYLLDIYLRTKGAIYEENS